MDHLLGCCVNWDIDERLKHPEDVACLFFNYFSNCEDFMWEETDKNIQWSLGGQSNDEGRRIMRDALAQANIAFMGDFKSGFHRTQDDNHVTALFDACCTENERRVYNLGRKHNGQPDI